MSAGHAFLAAASNPEGTALSHPAWSALAIRSGRRQFRGASLHLLNYQNARPIPGFSPCPAELSDVRKRILDLAIGAEHTASLPPIDMEGNRRFIAKVALGVGAGVIGESFVTGSDAQRLRRVLAANDYDEIDAIAPDIRGFGNATNLAGAGLVLKGAHLLCLIPGEDGLWLIFNLWGDPWFTAACRLAASPSSARATEGQVFIIGLARRRQVGPIAWEVYLRWVSGITHGDLDSLGIARPVLAGDDSAA